MRRSSSRTSTPTLILVLVVAAVACLMIRSWAIWGRPPQPQGLPTLPPPVVVATTRGVVVVEPPTTRPGHTPLTPPRVTRKLARPTDGIDEVALRQAVNGTLFVIPVNDGYVDFGLNLLCSLRKLGMGLPWPSDDHDDGSEVVKGVVFVAMDSLALAKLTAMRLPVVKDPNVPFVSADPTGWGNGTFHRLVCTKLIPVIRFLKLGLNVILSDADIVFNMDPRPFFRHELDMTFSIGSCHKDLADNFNFATDEVAKLNTGFYFAKSTPGVINLMTRALSNCRESHLTGDQPAINSVLHSDLLQATSGAKVPPASKYTYGFFDGCLFANGCIYFKHLCANTSMVDPRPDIAAGKPLRGKVVATKLAPGATVAPGSIRRDEPVMVHANFLVGKKDKVKHLIKYHLWDEGCIADWMKKAKAA